MKLLAMSHVRYGVMKHFSHRIVKLGLWNSLQAQVHDACFIFKRFLKNELDAHRSNKEMIYKYYPVEISATGSSSILQYVM